MGRVLTEAVRRTDDFVDRLTSEYSISVQQSRDLKGIILFLMLRETIPDSCSASARNVMGFFRDPSRRLSFNDACSSALFHIGCGEILAQEIISGTLRT